ncbi:MAG: AraC family transcriptional regulator [Bacteroidota bacterium]
MLLNIFYVVSILCLYSTAMCALFVWKNRKSIGGANELYFFIICFLLYLIYSTFRLPVALSWIIVSGAFLISISIWFLSKSLFSGKRLSLKKKITICVSALILYYGLGIWDIYSDPRYPEILISMISVYFIYCAINEAIKSKEHDKKSTKARKFFILGVCLISLFSLFTDIGLSYPDKFYVIIIQRIFILGLLTYATNVSFTFRKNIFLETNKSTSSFSNPLLLEKIENVVSNEKLYLSEKLTIGQLATQIDEHEYMVRQAIIQGLGYRNFIDFINSFRLKNAVGMLQDQELSNLTVMEIARKSGFSSIGPFNRAFKASIGSTPTEFRKNR